MTKEDIYDKLEYNGKYDTKTKTRLRNLIKENVNDEKVYSLLLEVQKELETGKAKITSKKTKNKNDNIDNNRDVNIPKKKKEYVKKEKVKKDKKKKHKKNKTPIVARVFIVLFILLMLASSISTIFYYFR